MHPPHGTSLSQKLPEQAVELGEHALVGPFGEVAVDGVPVWEVVREVPPLDPGAVHVQDRVLDVAQVVLGRSAESIDGDRGAQTASWARRVRRVGGGYACRFSPLTANGEAVTWWLSRCLTAWPADQSHGRGRILGIVTTAKTLTSGVSSVATAWPPFVRFGHGI